MAYKEARIRYESFTPEARASMIMVLEQYPDWLNNIRAIAEQLKPNGAFLLEVHEAVLLARLIAPHYPDWAKQLLAHPAIERVPALSPQEWQVRFAELVDRIEGQ